MVFTQKYTIISPIENFVVGQVFDSVDWPLHVTLADTFAIAAIDENLVTKLRLATKNRSLEIATDRPAHFGKDEAVEVMLLSPSHPLYALHCDIVDILLNKGAVFNDPQFTKDGFIGHVTQRQTKHLEVKQVVSLDSIAIVDMFPDGDAYKRRVMKIISLKDY